MTKDEYEAFQREYSVYLDETGQNNPPSDDQMIEQAVVMGQPCQEDIEAMRKERVWYCRQHLSSMPDEVGISLYDFHEMRGYYDSAAFLAEYGNHSCGETDLLTKFACAVDKMSYAADPYDYCSNIDMNRYMVNGKVDDNRVHADQVAVIYQDLTNGNAGYIADWIDDNIRNLEASAKQTEHVETVSEYDDRMQKEAAFFQDMKFEEVLQYRIDNGMALTDSDRSLINRKIVNEYTDMVEEHTSVLELYEYEREIADARVSKYANNLDAQRKVAAYGGNVPAYLAYEYDYPVDEHGRPYTENELCELADRKEAENTAAFEAARDKFFERVYEFHDLTTTPDALPKYVTGGKSAVLVITPSTFDALGRDYNTYHANRVQQKFADAGVVRLSAMDGKVECAAKPVQSTGLPVVDFSKPASPENAAADKTLQNQQTVVHNSGHRRMADADIDRESEVNQGIDRQASHADNYNQREGQRDQCRDDEDTARRNRSGLSGFEGNDVQKGRSNPDYDFDEYD